MTRATSTSHSVDGGLNQTEPGMRLTIGDRLIEGADWHGFAISNTSIGHHAPGPGTDGLGLG